MWSNNIESAWGVLAAVACGVGVRYWGPITGVGGWVGGAAVVGACLISLIDAWNSPD